MGSPVTEQELIRQREANATTPSWGQIIATFSQSEKVEISSVVLVAFKDSPLKYFLFCARFTYNVIYRKNTGSSVKQMSWAQMGTITGCCHCQEHCSLKGKVWEIKSKILCAAVVIEEWENSKTILWAPRFMNKKWEEMLQLPEQRFLSTSACRGPHTGADVYALNHVTCGEPHRTRLSWQEHVEGSGWRTGSVRRKEWQSVAVINCHNIHVSSSLSYSGSRER